MRQVLVSASQLIAEKAEAQRASERQGWTPGAEDAVGSREAPALVRSAF